MYKYQYTKKLKGFARKLRRNQTDVEKFLWYRIRRKNLGGFRFRRQFPFGKYILDFYCPEKKLAIELDGGQHCESSAKDECRDKYLLENGIKVLRFWNNVVFTNTEGVLITILQNLEETPS